MTNVLLTYVFLIGLASCTAAPTVLDAKGSVSDGPSQTYWWCEMHHAPQNIPDHSQVNSLVKSLANSPDTIEASKASTEDLRTKVISYSGLQAPLKGNDPIPPQTFWCEMHQGAQAGLTEGDNAEKLTAALAPLSREDLIKRVVEAEGKLAGYLNKIKEIQAALADKK